MKKLYYLLAVCAFSLQGYAQPANDDCSGAIELTVNSNNTCTAVTAGSLTGATDSGEGDNGAGLPNDDVWYTFTATASTQIIKLLNITGTPTDLVHEVLDGSCNGGLTSIKISDPNTSIVTGLSQGSVYYLRVFSYRNAPAESTTFNVCISAPPPAPENDDCFSAVSITPNPTFACTTLTPGTLSGATDSGEGDNGAGTPSDDVWYTFEATNASQKISILNVTGDTTDLVHEILEGNCGGGFTSLLISDADTSTVTNLAVGNTYYLRVFSYQAAPSLSTSFNVCVGTPPPAPDNDDCSNAVPLTVNESLTCAATTAGTLTSATDSGEGDNGAGLPNDDVWYTFVATAPTHIISLTNVLGTPTDLVHEVMEGSCNGGLASLLISDADFSTAMNLTPGNTYYVRVFSYRDTPAESTTFNICVGTPPELINDECTDAIDLTVNPDFDCAVVTSGTLAGATDSGEGDNGAGTPSDDVWYTFTATSTSQRISLLDITGNTTDLVHEVLEGSCGGGLTSISISDPNTTNLTGLTVGNTYYVRVFSYQTAASTSTNFNICIGTPPPPPSNDECNSAISLFPSGNFAGGAIDGTVGGATDSAASSGAPASGCNGYVGGDIWYTTTIPTSGNLTIETGPSSSGVTTFDSVVSAYSGDCDNLTVISCDDDGAATEFFSKLSLTGRTPGETIYIRVYEYNNDETEPFQIAVYDAALATSTFDNSKFGAHPNPVTDILNLSYTKNISDVQVYNLLGQQIITEIVNNREDKLDMSHLPSGTYLVKVNAEGETKTIKVFKR